MGVLATPLTKGIICVLEAGCMRIPDPLVRENEVPPQLPHGIHDLNAPKFNTRHYLS